MTDESHPIPNDEQSIRSIEQFKKIYFPKSHKEDQIKNLMKRIDAGDKKAIKELAKRYADEIFAELRSGKQEGSK